MTPSPTPVSDEALKTAWEDWKLRMGVSGYDKAAVDLAEQAFRDAFISQAPLLRDALQAANRSLRSVTPRGWVLVPREPTEAMLRACPYVRTGLDENGAWGVTTEPASVTWAAMVAAAPQPSPAHDS